MTIPVILPGQRPSFRRLPHELDDAIYDPLFPDVEAFDNPYARPITSYLILALTRRHLMARYYRENRFIIGDTSEASDSRREFHTVIRWRGHLRENAKHLRDVMLVTPTLHIKLADWKSDNEELIARARLDVDGQIVFELQGCGVIFCACYLRTALDDEGERQRSVGRSVDGTGLLNLLETCFEGEHYLYYDDPAHGYPARYCQACGLGILAHQPYL